MPNNVSSSIRNHLRQMAPHVRARKTAELLESAAGEIDRLEEARQLPTMTRLLSLLEGLESPNPQWWTEQPPEALRILGQAVAKQAKYNARYEVSVVDKERNNHINELIDELKSGCNRHVNGICQTLACLERGGYKHGDKLDYEDATCKRHEQALALEKCLLMLKSNNL